MRHLKQLICLAQTKENKAAVIFATNTIHNLYVYLNPHFQHCLPPKICLYTGGVDGIQNQWPLSPLVLGSSPYGHLELFVCSVNGSLLLTLQ